MGELISGLVDFDLQPGSGTTLTQQIYQQLRQTILAGSLPPGHRLPSSRDLARQLKTSRNTVSFVIDQLAMEGYLDVRQGRRPTIAAASNTGLVVGRATSRRRPATLRISRWAERLQKADWPFAGRFSRDWPMAARSLTNYGRAACDARPATHLHLVRPP
jgi:GntR family transcriptional regulator / MocR family aminotransferase